MSKKIKVDDLVEVITGKDKGKQGKVLSLHTSSMKIIVDGVNVCKLHKKKTEKSEAKIYEVAKPIHLSNVMLVCPDKKVKTKVGLTKKDKQLKRISKVSKKLF